jgi:parallel beta-helix repeat protein
MKHYDLRVIAAISIALTVIAMTVMSGEFRTGPLYVSGIDDLLSQGIITRGTGTAEDPYFVENLIIDGSTADYGLVFENISVYLVISDCTVANVLNPQAQGGIVLRGCSNVTIRHCNIHNNAVGLRLSHCSDVRVLNNRISGNIVGLRIDTLSRNNLIVGNYLDNDINAWACCSNTWNDNNIGNFWSDFPRAQKPDSDVYSISSGNQDRMPASCNSWLGDKYIPSPPIKPESPPSVAPIAPTKEDRTPPVIELKGGSELHFAVGECFIDPGWTATDDQDGDLSYSVLCKGQVDTSQPGTYAISYTVTDSSNNQSRVTRMILITDETPPVIELLGDPQIELPLGEEFKDPGVIGTDNCDGDISDQITVECWPGLNVSTPGIYTIQYSVTDKAGNRASNQRSVIVGWPNPIKSGGIEAIVETLDVQIQPAHAHIRISYANNAAPNDLQLQVGHILHTLVFNITRFTNAPVLNLTITDQEGELVKLAIELDTSLAFEGINVPPIRLFKSFDISSFREGNWLDFTHPSRTCEEAERRIEAALDTSELSEFPMQVRATSIMTLDGSVSFSIQLSGKLVPDKADSFPTLQRIRDIAATMEFLTTLAIMAGYSEIEVVFSADFYGLLYKNVLIPSDMLNAALRENTIEPLDISQYSNEVFTHPVLDMNR